MHTVFTAALPVFALILLGYGCARTQLLGPAASETLNRFVVYLALPPLLFLGMARMQWDELTQFGYLAAYSGGLIITLLMCMIWQRRRQPVLADRAIEGLAASYSNAGFMGIPLCLAVLGTESLAPTVLGMLMTACALFGAVIVIVEADQQKSAHKLALLQGVGATLLRNPLIVAPLLGMMYSATGLPIPVPADRLGELLANAASPCALVAIGLFLAQPAQTGDQTTVVRIVGIKLLVQPAVTAVLAFWVFDMPRVWAQTALLMSALPTGTGPFMLARLYGRDASLSSRVILVSTVGSVVTISLLVSVLG